MNSARTSKSNDLTSAAGDKDPESTFDGLRQKHAALTEENRKLKLLAEYRSAFLARLAHELRTPLTSILGFAEIMLSQEELTEPQRNFCERIQNSAQQLQMNFNQLADLSRLEGGQSEVQREEFSLEDVLRESCASVARQARKQKVGLQSEAGPGLPLVISDRAKLRQVLYNFLAYAINRSPEGAFVRLAAKNVEHGFLITIDDEGQPLAESTEVGQWDATDRRFGDSELGLAIARHNVDLLSATLSWQARPPRGLRITIQLPAAVPARPTSQEFT